MIELHAVVRFEERTDIEPAGSRAVGGQLADRAGHPVEPDEVLVHHEVIVVDRDYDIGSVFIRQQGADVAPLDRIEPQVRPQFRKPAQVLPLGRNVQVHARIVGDGLTEIGSPGRALSIADHHEVEVLVPIPLGILRVFQQKYGDVDGRGYDGGLHGFMSGSSAISACCGNAS